MWPSAHPFVGYLLYSLYARRTGAPFERDAIVALVAGTLVPDLVDKPLHWWVAVPSGRTLAHSLLFAAPLIAIAWSISVRYDRRRVGTAFGIGYLSHLGADTAWPLLVGAHRELGFLLWPITQSPPYEGQKPLAQVAGVEVTTLWLEIALILAATLVWYRDGTPGASTDQ